MSMKFLAYPGNLGASKALIAAKFGNQTIEYPNDFKMGVDNKTEEFLHKNPNGQVPTLETPDGPVWESNAIARYVARKGDKGLLGSNEYEATLVDQWIEWTRSKVEAPVRSLVMSLYGWGEPLVGEKHDQTKNELLASVKILDKFLTGKEYLVGNRVTLADIIVIMTYLMAIKHVLDKKSVSEYKNFTSYVDRLVKRTEFSSVLGEVNAWPEQEAAAGSLKTH